MEYSIASAAGEWSRPVFEAVLLHIQAKIRALQADEEMDDDALSILDVEQVILIGQIVERQRDRNTGDWKYLINGQTDDGLDVIDSGSKTQPDRYSRDHYGLCRITHNPTNCGSVTTVASPGRGFGMSRVVMAKGISCW
jgi:hypothetical protein